MILQQSTLHFSGLRRARSFKKLGFSMILNLIRGDARRFFAFLSPNSNSALTWISSPGIDLYGSCLLFVHVQVITKLLYLLNQGETFTKVSFTTP